MSLLAKVTKGKIEKPALMLLFGPEGVGKTTFAAQAPDVVFVGPEEGSNNLDVARFPVSKTWEDVQQATDELIHDKHEFKSVCFDSIDTIERLLHAYLCRKEGKKSIELCYGGYGKGYIRAMEMIEEWLTTKIRRLRDERGMNVILLAHSDVIPFNDPGANATYDRYQIKLHKRLAPIVKEFVDTVLFANYKVFAKEEGKATRAYGNGARIMYTERRPGFDAKNRFGLPPELPLGWVDYERARQGSSLTPDRVREQIVAMLDECDEDLKQKVVTTVERAGDNLPQLEAIMNRLRIKLEESGE